MNFLKNFFKNNSRRSREEVLIEKWLGESENLVDLERRQRMIDQGLAPWQVQANINLKGWA